MTITRRTFLGLVGVACCGFLLFVFRLLLNNSANGLKGQYQPKELVAKNNSIPEMQQSKTVVLAYTYSPEFKIIMGERCVWYEHEKRQCPWDLFEITFNKRRFAESNFVIFNAGFVPNVNELKELLKSRPTSQRWVYHSWECPRYVKGASPFNGFFNLTWTYRTDSDFSQPFGNYEPLGQEEIKKNEMAGVTDYTQGKSELVAWMVSNCGPQLRLNFVRELKKFIKVDVFGKCSSVFGQSNSCPKGNTSECVRKYKFYLSFENWLCEDYITEKYWGNLGDGNVVPVVMGGADYTKLAIPGSYINVLDFKTVKELAEYLQYLDKNNTAYNEYFKWRLLHKVVRTTENSFCSICKWLYPDKLPKTKVYEDLGGYWANGKCNQKDEEVRKMFNN